MASSTKSATPQPSSEYVVVARRYRPQSFSDLVGQHQASQALANAIRTNRIGHAYLFTGARGVGKTSAARIFAKALNCEQGPTPEPCNQCDLCQGITAGEDVDVLEIDGASNRGIDEIRQLRSNANIRPGRARFKIYIIDEVHMLTTPAFNALLKTLEEPPEHVKFIFCTTDPEKIPITVLSRCQRFDFAPVKTDAIVERLRQIVENEGGHAEDAALQILARRAAGSMRDSQSLLEQLLSFGGSEITVAEVHAMLGTAETGRLAELTQQLAARDAPAALRALDQAVNDGVDVSQLTEQLVAYFRDLMAAAVGCDATMMLQAGTDDFEQLRSTAQEIGLESLLAMLQILDQSLTKMRQSTQSRMLLEVALVRICHLEQLDELPQILAMLQTGKPAEGTQPAPRPARRTNAPPPPQKKNESVAEALEPSPPNQPSASIATPITKESAENIWKQLLAEIEDMTADFGKYYERVATPAPNRLVVSFRSGYTLQKEGCERPERKARIEQVLSRITGCHMRVDFELLEGDSSKTRIVKKPVSLRQRMRDTEKRPFVKAAMDLFGAEIIRVDPARPKQGK